MKENNIFPEDILHNTVEYHIAKYSKKSNWIFWIIVLTLVVGFISLPFIEIDLYTTSRGRIISQENIVSIYPPASGRISEYNVFENKKVKKGDTLLIIDQKILQEQKKLLEIQLIDYQGFIEDLTKLLSKDYTSIKTEHYKTEHLKYQQELYNFNVIIKNAKTEYDRAAYLFKEKVISQSDYDKELLTLNKLKNDRVNFIKQANLTWQKELTNFKQSSDNTKSSENQLIEEENRYVLIAPIDGELINVQGITDGSTVALGNLIAQISPDKNLIIETYVSPSDIGFIAEKAEAKYQIDAYNSNQWGFATGNITEIGSDIVFVNNMPVYKIRSSINEKCLFLRNGSVGKLKKGMTNTSRFFLTTRSLSQLLFDSIDNWINPYNNKNE